MYHGKYNGPIMTLQGKEALFRRENGEWMAQFDDTSLPREYTHGWIKVKKKHIVLDKLKAVKEEMETWRK